MEGVGAAEAGEAQAGPVQVAWGEAEGKTEAEGKRDAEGCAVLVEERLGQLLGEAVRESVPVAAKEGSETVEDGEGEWGTKSRAESVCEAASEGVAALVAEGVVVRPSEGEPPGEPDGKPEREKETLGKGVCEFDTLALKLLVAL